MKSNKRVLSILLSLTLALTMLAVPAFANESDENESTGEPAVTHTLTVNYVYSEDSEAEGVPAEPFTSEIAEDEEYSIESPAIEGYTPDKEKVEGVMGTEDITETVSYSEKQNDPDDPITDPADPVEPDPLDTIETGYEDGIDMKYGGDSVQLEIESKYTLSYEVLTEEDAEVVVAVNESGLVEAKGVGTSVIKVIGKDADDTVKAQAEINVTVSKGDQKIKLSDDTDSEAKEQFDIELSDGAEVFELGASAFYDAENTILTYESSNEEQASVDESGKVTVNKTTEPEPVEITITASETELYGPASRTVFVSAEEWIPVLDKPANSDVEVKEAVVCRRGGRNSGLEIYDADAPTIKAADISEEDKDNIINGDLEIWNGYIYKKAGQDIRSAIDTEETTTNEDGEETTTVIKVNKLTLKYGCEPVSVAAEAAGKAVTYASSDEGVVEVSEDGMVSPKGLGEAVVSIKAEGDVNYKTSIRRISVTVDKGDQTVTTGKDEYNVVFGTSDFSLDAATYGSGELSFASDNEDAVSVSEDGVVSVKDITTEAATITITAAETDLYEKSEAKTVTVNVAKPATPKLTVSAIGKKKIKLSWTAVPGAVKYEVYCPQFKKSQRNGSTTGTSITSKKLKKGKKYKCMVRAIVRVGNKTYTTNWTAYVTSPKVK